ncbi:hypothetical protein [Nonlabens ulvanivorans]|uniref:hypothetical protein n=1 Tax=Nonlabens ulvanivorans TaxID=906888 RepID=UPI0029430A50|nr:hypothetical protein [Nonlabens ulvanivorans]WOI21969.1 hypothetical protein R1T42_09830 [Nonlabens ulvanivorans]
MKNPSNYIAVIILLLSLLSCTEKIEESKPLIEIYQLNKRIVSYEGEPFVFTEEMTEMDPEFTNAFKDILRVTDDRKWTPNGTFNSSQIDLRKKPLITNEQIKGFDFTSDELILDEKACEYFGIIKKINDSYSDTQLVLTIDRKPILNFYRAGTMSKWDVGKSHFVLECGLMFSDSIGTVIEKRENALQIFHGPFSNNDWWKTSPDLKKDTAFYNAFKRAGKIIAE